MMKLLYISLFFSVLISCEHEVQECETALLSNYEILWSEFINDQLDLSILHEDILPVILDDGSFLYFKKIIGSQDVLAYKRNVLDYSLVDSVYISGLGEHAKRIIRKEGEIFYLIDNYVKVFVFESMSVRTLSDYIPESKIINVIDDKVYLLKNSDGIKGNQDIVEIDINSKKSKIIFTKNKSDVDTIDLMIYFPLINIWKSSSDQVILSYVRTTKNLNTYLKTGKIISKDIATGKILFSKSIDNSSLAFIRAGFDHLVVEYNKDFNVGKIIVLDGFSGTEKWKAGSFFNSTKFATFVFNNKSIVLWKDDYLIERDIETGEKLSIGLAATEYNSMLFNDEGFLYYVYRGQINILNTNNGCSVKMDSISTLYSNEKLTGRIVKDRNSETILVLSNYRILALGKN